jgi:hypothetical protein
MKTKSIGPAALAAVILATSVMAQDMPDIGFDSVGRGRPLAASVNDRPEVGPSWIRGPGIRSVDRELLGFNGFRPDELPDDYEPLPEDIFTSTDFYADEALWTDPRYYRCNSPQATEFQQGILFPPPLTEAVEDGPWGHCDVDYPIEAIRSPYEFASAQERIHDDDGGFVGVNHEAIFYDPEALAEPIRIVRNLTR